MAVFHTLIELVNRTSKIREVIYDGQRKYLEPNYTSKGELIPGVHNMVPEEVIPYALNQNVLMGSEDAIDPSDFQSLIGVKPDKKVKNLKSWHDCSYLEQSEELTRTPLADVLEDPTLKIIVRGKTIPRAIDALLPGATTPFDPR